MSPVEILRRKRPRGQAAYAHHTAAMASISTMKSGPQKNNALNRFAVGARSR
jgi:hypothetical protein